MIDSNVRIFSLNMKAYVDASCDHRFFLTASLKFGQLAKIFGQMVHPPPARQKIAHTPM